MSNIKFIVLLWDNLFSYISILMFVIFVFSRLWRKYTHTWFDPLRFQMLISAFAVTIPIFLYVTNVIGTVLFTYIIIAETAFWLGFIILAKEKILFSKRTLKNEESIGLFLFIVSFICYVSFTLITYVQLGIPLFAESRLSTYIGSGLGFMSRMNGFFSIYILVYSFYYLNKEQMRLRLKLLFVFSILIITIAGVLSGSRSSFLTILFAYWGYRYLFTPNLSNINKYYKYIVVFIVISLVTFGLQANTKDIIYVFQLFFERVVANGDTFWMSLPNDVWKNVEIKNTFDHLFLGLLGPLRIIDEAKTSPPIGFQLFWDINPTLAGQMFGPLSRASILGLIYFNWGGIFFSFFIGLFISIIIYRLPFFIPQGVISKILYFYIYTQSLVFISDVSLGMNYAFNTLFNLCFVLIFIVITGSLILIIKSKDENINCNSSI